jgi:uncharacterized membrane protein YsdA (DUF1294 family)
MGLGLFAMTWLLLGWPVLVAWVLAWSWPAFALYAIDKRQAGQGGWRVPEIVLHGLALVGGFPGAWIGRTGLRHKTAKPAFLLVLLGATAAWGVVAVGSLSRP